MTGFLMLLFSVSILLLSLLVIKLIKRIGALERFCSVFEERMLHHDIELEGLADEIELLHTKSFDQDMK